MIKTKDDLNRKIVLQEIPQRIVSLVPSITELLVDMGLEENIVGVTKFCVHPKHLKKSKPLIGGTKSVKTTIINELKPDIIFASKEENDQKQVTELILHHRVFVSDIKTLKDATRFNKLVGKIFEKEASFLKIDKAIKKAFSTAVFKNEKALYLIWKNPYMTVGGDTYISDIMSKIGLANVLKTTKRYPSIDAQYIEELEVDYIFLSSEPFPFKEKHIIELKELNPQAKVILVDGEAFSWYGSRLSHIPDYFKSMMQQLKRSSS